jgi:GGDEF domain-containing protein
MLALSVGVAEVPPDARELQSSVQEADSKMYEDKRRRAAGKWLI